MTKMDRQWRQWIANGNNGLPLTTVQEALLAIHWFQTVPVNYIPKPNGSPMATMATMHHHYRHWCSIVAIDDSSSPLAIHCRHWRSIVAIDVIVAIGDELSPLSPLAPLAPVGDVKYCIAIYFRHGDIQVVATLDH